MMLDKQFFIDKLDLSPNPVGGYYREIRKSPNEITMGKGSSLPLYRTYYYLVDHENNSAFHSLDADETWYYHEGESVVLHLIFPNSDYKRLSLGPNLLEGDVLQYTIPKDTIYAACVDIEGAYSLVSCQVSPGIDLAHVHVHNHDELLRRYPQHEFIINQYSK